VLTPGAGLHGLPDETLLLEENGDEVRAYVEEMVGAAGGARGG
jgi:hypothetical protein